MAPFPGPGGKLRVSTAGGTFPRWRRDGKEIFYLAPDNKLMAAEVKGHAPALAVGTISALFEIHPAILYSNGYPYDVTSDGQRFLVNMAVEQKEPVPITLVQNWTAGLKK